jgi:hypothetical protein
MRFFFLKPLHIWATAQTSRFESEAEIRIRDQDLEKLRPAPLRIFIALAATITLVGAFRLAAPPIHPITRIEKFNHLYISTGQMCWDTGQSLTCKEVRFPPGDADRPNAQTRLPVEYRLDVMNDSKAENLGLSSLLIPMIWGQSTVYRNDILMFRGPNTFDFVPLLPGLNRILIKVTSPSEQKVGIRGIYPPTLLSAESATDFRDALLRDSTIYDLALGLQLMIVAVLAMFWVWSKSQPELLFFLIVAIIEVLKNSLWIVMNAGQTFMAATTDQKIYESLGSLSILLTVPFALAVCRVPLRQMTDMPRKYGLQYLGIVIATAVALMSLLNAMPISSARTIGFIAASAVFVLWISVPRLSYMLFKQLYSRFFLTALTMTGVIVWYSRLVLDLSHLYTHITTEYNDQLFFFVVMAGLLAYQFGKTESRFSQVKKLASREAIHKVERQHIKGSRIGFIILVDIVGWTAMRRSIPTDEGRNEFSEITLRTLFEAFDSADFSVPHQGGDSVFFTRESGLSKEVYEDALRRCKTLCLRRPTMKELGVTAPEVADKIFIARSAIYYGPYDIVIAKSKHHHKETFTGDAPETCTRIIGNEPDPKTVRIVADTALDAFRPDGVQIAVAAGKGNKDEPDWRYWET